MRDILSKLTAGSMIAGAALLVAACSGGGSEANNTADANLGGDIYNTEVPTDTNLGGTDLNGGVGGNVGADMNASGNVGGTTGTDAGAGAGNASTGGNATNTQ